MHKRATLFKIATITRFFQTSRSLACLLALFLVLPATATPAQIQKLIPSDGGSGQAFGYSISVNGNLGLAGAYFDDDKGVRSGSAYVFNAVTGEQLLKFTASDGAAEDQFGRSVALSGNLALVGSYKNDDNGLDSGSAYVFNATTGEQLVKLLPDDGAANDNFGLSVALTGNLAIVGSKYDNASGTSSGSAYVFNATTGEQLVKLIPNDGAANDLFGTSVSISGNLALVGAPYDDDHGSSSGSAYVFNASTGEQLAKLTPSDGAANDRFGLAVAQSGNIALVGAPYEDNGGTYSGSAYAFDTTTGGQLVKFAPSDGAANDLFGDSVALSGYIAIVGSDGDDDSGASSGSAYMFNAATGEQMAKLVPGDGAAGDLFGLSVSVSGNLAMAGAYQDDDSGSGSGSAYVFYLGNAINPIAIISQPSDLTVAPGQEAEFHVTATEFKIPNSKSQTKSRIFPRQNGFRE